ncbi:hypothetical protein BGW41_004764 [Actinomortierella wolfii]|nr:hypothetical protein BGW41_004764 [Actinomortierella wolfii]
MHKMMRPSDLVFTYKNTRLLPSATPRSLLMPPVVVLDIYTDAGYKFMKMQAVHEHDKLIAQNSQPETSTQPSNLTDAKSPQGVTGHDVGTFTKDGEDQEKHDESEFLFIKIRGKNTTDERMRVKKSTTIAAISNHYKKLKKIPENSFVKLEFDDETLDPSSTIAHTDIEDDDMLTATIVS